MEKSKMEERKMSFGIDLNSRKVIVLLVSGAGEVISEQSIYAEVYRGEEYIVGKLAEAMERMIKKSGVSREDICGVGIAAPVVKNGSSPVPLHFEGWDPAAISRELSSATGFKIDLLNYGTATGMAEAVKSGGDDELILSVDIFETLISAGYIAGGRVPEGLSNINAGHMVIDSGGFKCPCGRNGCFSAMAGSEGIVKYYQAFAKQRISFANWKKLVGSRDLAALYALDKCAAAIAVGIGNILRIVDVDSLILGGDLILGIPGLFEKVKEEMDKLESHLPNIRKASVGDNGEAFGAAVYVHAN